MFALLKERGIKAVNLALSEEAAVLLKCIAHLKL